MKNFLLRKIIHIISGLILIWACLNLKNSKYYLAGAMIILLFLEVFRYRLPVWKDVYANLFTGLLTKAEKRSLVTGALTLWITIYLIFLVFTKEIFLVASLVLVLADPFAAISGRLIHTLKIYQNKTLLGSITFFSISWLIVWQYSNIPLILSPLLAIILCLIELYSSGKWENLFIGSASAIILMLIEKFL